MIDLADVRRYSDAECRVARARRRRCRLCGGGRTNELHLETQIAAADRRVEQLYGDGVIPLDQIADWVRERHRVEAPLGSLVRCQIPNSRLADEAPALDFDAVDPDDDAVIRRRSQQQRRWHFARQNGEGVTQEQAGIVVAHSGDRRAQGHAVHIAIADRQLRECPGRIFDEARQPPLIDRLRRLGVAWPPAPAGRLQR